MHPLALAARLRRPITIVVSVAAVAAMALPLEARQQHQPLVLQPVRVTPQPFADFTPARLQLPKLGIDAPVVQVLTAQDGTMGSPTNATDVGWYPGAKPGKGNALFDSHHDWNGAEGSFYRLEEIRPGDTVVVVGSRPGQKLTYVVVWTKQVNGGIDASDLLGAHAGKQETTLITCGGAFNTQTRHHVDRIVVRAELVWA
jgi:LPXTG-site transpeptidase (sortase) family protein